jgi:hypothetical protein
LYALSLKLEDGKLKYQIVMFEYKEEKEDGNKNE